MTVSVREISQHTKCNMKNSEISVYTIFGRAKWFSFCQISWITFMIFRAVIETTIWRLSEYAYHDPYAVTPCVKQKREKSVLVQLQYNNEWKSSFLIYFLTTISFLTAPTRIVSISSRRCSYDKFISTFCLFRASVLKRHIINWL